MPDMFNLLRQAQAMKQKMNEFQKELESQSFVGTAGKGAVTVTLNGKHDVLEVKISPEAAADVEKLQSVAHHPFCEGHVQDLPSPTRAYGVPYE